VRARVGRLGEVKAFATATFRMNVANFCVFLMDTLRQMGLG